MALTVHLFGATYDNVFQGWQAKQNEKGVFYYSNNALEITSWNHPFLTKVFEKLETYNDVKYAAYRTSFKLRALQKHIGLQWITLAGIKKVFAECFPAVVESETYMSCSEVCAVIQKVLETSDRRNLHTGENQRAADLILNLMLNLYDINRCGRVVMRSVRNALTALCIAKLSEKYRYFFSCLRDDSGNIPREKLLYFIDDLMQITDVIKESEAFGRNITAAVDSCFELSGKSASGGVSEDTFYTWLLKEPQTIVWLPSLHRMVATESVQHQVKCAVCKNMPITGFRYRCLQCLRYDMCQNCFLYGQTSFPHKLKHPMQEYCFPTSVKDNTKAFLRIMRNKLSKRHRRQTKIKYLPVDSQQGQGLPLDWQPEGLLTSADSDHSQSTDSGTVEICDNWEAGQDLLHSPMEAWEGPASRRLSRPVQVLGEPCNSSSPFVGVVPENVSGQLSKQDMDSQQLVMAKKIEELQRENEFLYGKLRTLQKQYGAAVLDVRSPTDVDKSISINPSTDDPLKITSTSPISPITAAVTASDIMASDTDNPLLNTLDIVGYHTPVLPSNDLPPSSGFKGVDATPNRMDDDKLGQHLSTQLARAVSQLSVSTTDTGVSYRSSDMNVDSSDSNEHDNANETSRAESVQGNSSFSCGLIYRTIDMSLHMKGNENQPVTETADQTETARKSVDSTSLMLPSGLKYSLNDMSLRFHETMDKTEEFVEVPVSVKQKSELASMISSESVVDSKALSSADDLSVPLSRVTQDADSSQDHCGNSLSMKDISSSRDFPSAIGQETSSYIPIRKVDKDTTSDDTYLDLSNIQCHSANLSSGFSNPMTLHSREPTPQGVLTQVENRRNTLAPVNMSTPVNQLQPKHIKAHSAFVKRPKSLLSLNCNEDKENRFDQAERRYFPNAENMFSKVSNAGGAGTTPLSSIPNWQRRRILVSSNAPTPNKSFSCQNLTSVGLSAEGLSMMFNKAEERAGHMKADTMATPDKEEMEKLMRQLETSDSPQLSYVKPNPSHDGRCRGESSMLEAVFTIGDAMAGLVNATTQQTHF